MGGRGRSMRMAESASSSHCRATDLSKKLGVPFGDVITVGEGVFVAVPTDVGGVGVAIGVVLVGLGALGDTVAVGAAGTSTSTSLVRSAALTTPSPFTSRLAHVLGAPKKSAISASTSA